MFIALLVNIFHLPVGVVAVFVLKRKLFIRFSHLFSHVVLFLFLELLLHKIAKTILLLAFLQLFPGIRTEGVIHLAPLLLFQLDERAVPEALHAVLQGPCHEHGRLLVRRWFFVHRTLLIFEFQVLTIRLDCRGAWRIHDALPASNLPYLYLALFGFFVWLLEWQTYGTLLFHLRIFD
jgi:hypothetical protein